MIASITLMLSACSNELNKISELFRPSTTGTAVRVVKGTPNVYKAQEQDKIPARITQNPSTRRINTTECKDTDDWYLDGYRVGKSFSKEKTQMLQQRMHFCQISQLPSHFKQNWERGFTIGSRENIRQKPHSIKSNKQKKSR